MAVLVCAAAVFALTRPGDVFNADVEFFDEPSQTSVPTPEPEEETPKKGKKKDPLAGLPVADLRLLEGPPALPADRAVGAAAVQDACGAGQFGVLLEFPPIIVGNRLFTVGNAGVVVALNRTTGQAGLAARRRLPRRLLARLRRQAHLRDDPRAHEGRPRGRIVALNAKTGRVAWSKPLPSRSESSPLFVDGRIYFGAEDGTVYAMRAKDGSTQWTFQAARRGQGRPRAGRRQALLRDLRRQRLRDRPAQRQAGLARGHQRRQLRPQRGQLLRHARPSPTGACTSATPTATCTRSRPPRGKLAWRRGTGSYVYASPAVAQVRNSKPTVYFGSLRRDLLRARRPQRRHALDAPRRRQDLRRRHRGRRHRLLLELGQARHDRACGRGRARWPGTAVAEPSTRSCPTARPSTSRASRRSPRCCPRPPAEERATKARQAKKAAKAKAAKKRKAAKKKAAAKKRKKAAAQEAQGRQAEGREEAAAAQQQRLAAGRRTSGL